MLLSTKPCDKSILILVSDIKDLLHFLIPSEPGERVKENPGEQRRLSERSEPERVQPRPGFFERANEPEGRVHGVPFLWLLSFGTKRK